MFEKRFYLPHVGHLPRFDSLDFSIFSKRRCSFAFFSVTAAAILIAPIATIATITHVNVVVIVPIIGCAIFASSFSTIRASIAGFSLAAFASNIGWWDFALVLRELPVMRRSRPAGMSVSETWKGTTLACEGHAQTFKAQQTIEQGGGL